MKKADVKVGNTYLTYVSGTLTRVVVTGSKVMSNNRTRFYVKREDNGRQLDARSPAALREPEKACTLCGKPATGATQVKDTFYPLCDNCGRYQLKPTSCVVCDNEDSPAEHLHRVS